MKIINKLEDGRWALIIDGFELIFDKVEYAIQWAT